MKSIRVLQVIRSMNIGGAETFIMNVYRNIDRNNIQFDFLVSAEGKYDDEIKKLGGKIYKIPYITEVGQFKYVKELKKFFKEHQEYTIIHSHIDQVSGIILETARKCNIQTRISHSHSTSNNNNFIGKVYKKYLQSKINKNATIKLACGKDAAKWLYKNEASNAITVNNGIDIEKFKYNEVHRAEIRENLGISENEKVIGHIGSFLKVKNHDFIIDIFDEFIKKHPQTTLVLVGDGILKKEIEDKVKKLEIGNKVKFLGIRNDVYKIYSAFDMLLFPSFFEGLSTVMIEAQYNGLKILTSTSIDKNTNISSNITFEDLNANIESWIKDIEKIDFQRDFEVEKHIKNDEYNIKNVAKLMQNIYLGGEKNENII